MINSGHEKDKQDAGDRPVEIRRYDESLADRFESYTRDELVARVLELERQLFWFNLNSIGKGMN